MPFVGAVIVPHSPLLLPTVGKEYAQQTKKTLKAAAQAMSELYAVTPDSLVILHPHGPKTSQTLTLNVAEEFSLSFAEFGDLVTTGSFRGNSVLAHHIKEQAEDAGLPVLVTHDPNLAYDAAIPMLGLPEAARQKTILPCSPTNLSPRVHGDFGRMLANVFHSVDQRVAVIVSAELSQHAAAAAPGGFRPEGQAFDTAVVKSFSKKHALEHLLDIPEDTVERAEACGYLPLVMFSGLVAQQNCHIRKLSYEHPFGIGLLVATVHPA